jgi:thymidylate synthase (FAD)
MIKVTLLSHTQNPEETILSAIRQCYSEKGGADLMNENKKKLNKKLINQVISSGHLSTIEHASFTFAIEGISRACTHQLVRHRIASFSQQSQRYVKFKNGKFEYIIPPTIAGNKEMKKKYEEMMKKIGILYEEFTNNNIKAEDARYLLPNAAETKIVVTMNCRSLLNFFKERLCIRAQWEIREMAQKMLKEVMKKSPEIFKFAGPTCEVEKICWEGNMSCGKWKIIKGAELRNRI